MLTLLVALSLSAPATVLEDPPSMPPPLVLPDSAPQAAPAELPVAAPYQPSPRSARLLEAEPRVSAGALVGRVAMAVTLGLVGRLTGELAGIGLVVLGTVSGSPAVLITTVVLGALVAAGVSLVGIALGSALFGQNFSRDFSDALPVAAVAVASALALSILVGLALPYLSPLLVYGVPLLAAAVVTPLIVQARKPSPELTAVRDALPAHGLAFSF